MTYREKTIEQAAGASGWSNFDSSGAQQAFIEGARWADENPKFQGDDHYECKERLATVQAQLDEAVETLKLFKDCGCDREDTISKTLDKIKLESALEKSVNEVRTESTVHSEITIITQHGVVITVPESSLKGNSK